MTDNKRHKGIRCKLFTVVYRGLHRFTLRFTMYLYSILYDNMKKCAIRYFSALAGRSVYRLLSYYFTEHIYYADNQKTNEIETPL